jgi:RNA polymerase sigma-70 factor (sigma-E family)
VRAADDSDFTDFVAGSSRRLLGLAYLLTGDRYAAEDLLQGALERTYRHWPRLNRDGVPEAYVRRALVNAATDRWRRRKGVVEVELADEQRVAADDHLAADGTEASIARDALVRAVRELPTGQRAVLALRYFEGLTEAQTAAVMGCSIGTVKSQHAKALTRLRTLMPSGRL